MEKFDPDWWKTIFDETYLITDARSVCDEDLTRREVDFLVKALALEKSWPILDLCGGQGRHSLELSRRGFQHVTVLDHARFLVSLGSEKAKKEGLKVLFLQGDARDTGLSSGRFRVVVVMAGSFGYFVDERENERILIEAFRLLRPDGSLLLDLPHREQMLHRFNPRSWHEGNEDIVVCRRRRLEGDIVFSREMVLSKMSGLVRDVRYCTRLYRKEKITTTLKTAGFRSVNIHEGFASGDREADRGLMGNRMFVIATK